MDRRARFARLTVVLLAATAPLAAQALTPGTWQGAVTQPNGTDEPVAFEVAVEGEEIQLSMSEDGGARIQFSDVHFEDDDLVFTWRSGEAELRCSLAPAGDGGYAGNCGDLGLRMSPPAAD